MSDLPGRASDAGPDVPAITWEDPWFTILDARDAAENAAQSASEYEDQDCLKYLTEAEQHIKEARELIEKRRIAREERSR